MKLFLCLFQQILLSIIVFLSCFYTGFTKPVFLENQPINQQLRDHGSRPQGDAFRPEESINQQNDVISTLDEFLDRPSAHNRTARDAGHPCVSKIVRKYDHCRRSYVNVFQCKPTRVSCFQAIPKYGKPLCKTVFGFYQAKFISKCPSLAIDCQCAA